MAQYLLDTENLTTANWTAEEDIIRTYPNPYFVGPPYFAGGYALQPTALEDASATKAGLVKQVANIPVDSNPYVASLLVNWSSDESAFPCLFIEFPFGAPAISCGVQLNTNSGAVAIQPAPADPPDDYGVQIIEGTNWWRLWVKKANNGTGDGVRLVWFPAIAGSLGGGFNSPSTKLTVAWGAQITQGSVMEYYQPNPTYLMNRLLVKN